MKRKIYFLILTIFLSLLPVGCSHKESPADNSDMITQTTTSVTDSGPYAIDNTKEKVNDGYSVSSNAYDKTQLERHIQNIEELIKEQ